MIAGLPELPSLLKGRLRVLLLPFFSALGLRWQTSDVPMNNLGFQLSRRKVGHYLPQQSEPGRNLSGAHLALALNMFNKRIEDIRVLDFNPVFVTHLKTGLTASGHSLSLKSKTRRGRTGRELKLRTQAARRVKCL